MKAEKLANGILAALAAGAVAISAYSIAHAQPQAAPEEVAQLTSDVALYRVVDGTNVCYYVQGASTGPQQLQCTLKGA